MVSSFVQAASGAEAAAVVGGADPHPAVEGAAHGLDGPEAGARGDGLHGRVARLERHAGRSPRGRSPRTRPASCRPRGRRRGRSCARSCARVSASAGTERSASTLSAIQACSSRSGRRSAGCAVSWALNCAWPPGRLTNRTSQRAVVERRLAPEVLLHQRQRQVHPGGHAGRRVDVAVAHEDRVRVHLDVRDGARPAARSSPSAWWRGGPSSSPAAASRNAPVQTPATRRERPAASRSAARKRSSRSSASTPVPPATTSVSIGPRTASSAASAARLTAEAFSGPGSGAAIVTE